MERGSVIQEMVEAGEAGSLTSKGQRTIGSERHFALCESCFWSASIFDRSITVCPSCMNENISMMPLSRDEEYRMSVSHSAGVELSFSRARQTREGKQYAA